MRIEFIGVTGSGKTYIANKILPDLKQRFPNIIWPWRELFDKNRSWFLRNIRKAFSVCSFGFFHFCWVTQLQKCIWLYTDTTFVQRITLLFNGIYLKSSLDRNQNCDTVYDEGLMQYIWAIHLRGKDFPSKDEVNLMVGLFGPPNILYVIDAPPEVIAQRIDTRGRRVFIQGSKDMISEVIRMKEICYRIVSLLKDICSDELNIKNIDNG